MQAQSAWNNIAFLFDTQKYSWIRGIMNSLPWVIQAWERWRMDRWQTDEHYLAHYLPASRSYTIDNEISLSQAHKKYFYISEYHALLFWSKVFYCIPDSFGCFVYFSPNENIPILPEAFLTFASYRPLLYSMYILCREVRTFHNTLRTLHSTLTVSTKCAEEEGEQEPVQN